MALTTEEKRERGKRAAANWIEQRRNDPAKMKKWLAAIQAGQRKAVAKRKREAREKQQAKEIAKEVTKMAKATRAKKPKRWQDNPKLIHAAVLKGHRTRKRKLREREAALAAQQTQRNIVAQHAPEDLVHLNFPVIPGQPTLEAAPGGYDVDALATPRGRKQLALEGLRFVRILLE